MKKAKFVIDIEYKDEHAGMTSDNINVKECRIEGDYEGLTIAMTTGLAFATHTTDGAETYADKTRILRATASAVASAMASLRETGVYDVDKDKYTEETEEVLGAAFKFAVDMITTGIARTLNVSPQQVKAINEKEYSNPKDNDNGSSEEGQQGSTGTDDIGDFI